MLGVPMSDETAQACHRRHAQSFHRLSVCTDDAKLRQLFTAIAELHGKIAARLATLDEDKGS